MKEVFTPEYIYGLVAEKKSLESSLEILDKYGGKEKLRIGDCTLDDPTLVHILAHTIRTQIKQIDEALNQIKIESKE